MVGASQRLIDVRNLLERALEQIDALDDTLLSVLVDTAIQHINAKIDASGAGE